MSFDSFSDFLAMGGHGLYVWLAYGAAVIIVVANELSLRAARRRYFREARARLKRLHGAGAGTGDALANPITTANEGGK